MVTLPPAEDMKGTGVRLVDTTQTGALNFACPKLTLHDVPAPANET